MAVISKQEKKKHRWGCFKCYITCVSPFSTLQCPWSKLCPSYFIFRKNKITPSEIERGRDRERKKKQVQHWHPTDPGCFSKSRSFLFVTTPRHLRGKKKNRSGVITSVHDWFVVTRGESRPKGCISPALQSSSTSASRTSTQCPFTVLHL